MLLALMLLLQETKTPTKAQQDVTIYGTSPEKGQELFDVPYSTNLIDDEDMVRRRMSRTFPEALEETPGVSVQKTGPGQGSPFIRGFTGFRNVLLIDGIRLNNSVFREGPNQYWATVDSYMLDRIEVVRGPSSVLYGSDSIGGTVLADTKDVEFRDATLFGGRTIGRAAYGENSYQARQELWMSSGGVGTRIGGTYRDYHDIDGGKHYGRMDGTGYDQYAADAKAAFRVGEKSELVIAAQRDRTHNSPRWHRTIDSDSWHGTAAGTELRDDFEQDRDLYYVQYRGRYENALVDAVTLSFSLHDQAEKENRKQQPANPSQQQVREFDVDTLGAFARVGKRTSAGYFTAGVEVYRDDVESSGYNVSAAGVRTDLPRGNVAGEAEYVLMGIYVQDEIQLGALDVVPGIRFTRASVDAEDVDPNLADATVIPDLDDDYQAVTGSLRLVYHVDENWNLIAGWGMGFRAPSLDDTTVVASVGAGSIDFGGPDLDPEKSHTFDLGVRADYESWGLSAFAFYTLLRDFIVRVPIGDVAGDPAIDFERENAADGWVYGFEVEFFVKPTEDWTLFFDWGYARGKVDQRLTSGADAGEQPLGKVGPSLAHLGLRYAPKEAAWWVEGLVTAADRQRHLSISDGADGQRIPLKHGTPGYTIYTIRGGWSLNEHAHLSAAIENLSDKDYRVHGSGQNEPGRSFVLGLDLTY